MYPIFRLRINPIQNNTWYTHFFTVIQDVMSLPILYTGIDLLINTQTQTY